MALVEQRCVGGMSCVNSRFFLSRCSLQTGPRKQVAVKAHHLRFVDCQLSRFEAPALDQPDALGHLIGAPLS